MVDRWGERGKLARYGVNVSDLQEVVETAIGGKEASKVYEGQKVFGLSVRFPEAARNDVEPVRNILISAANGAQIPLGELAQVYVKEGPAQITREMAAMSAKITGELLKGIKNLKSESPVINCTTCHRGQVKPATSLPPPPKS